MLSASFAMLTMRESAPYETFNRRAIDERDERWQLLTSLIGGEAWWERVLADFSFVAGGAALFVADPRSCVAQLGDIDLWMSCSLAAYEEYIRQLCQWFDDIEEVYVVETRRHSTVVLNARLNVQFIRNNHTVEATLYSFDYDAAQVAITLATPASPADQATLVPTLVYSDAAQAAIETRRILWRNDAVWCACGCASVTAPLRVKKYRAKKFVFGDGDGRVYAPPAHSCTLDHRLGSAGEERREYFIEFYLGITDVGSTFHVRFDSENCLLGIRATQEFERSEYCAFCCREPKQHPFVCDEQAPRERWQYHP